MNKKYQQLLLRPEWRAKRDLIIQRDNGKCTVCSKKTSLEVHHTYYYTVRTEPWKYPDESLISVCRNCHKKIHDTTEIPLKDNPNGEKPVQKPLNWTSYKKDMYRFLSADGHYKFGNYKFKNKSSIAPFIRCLLNELPIGEEIYDKNIVEFVHDLFIKKDSTLTLLKYVTNEVNTEYPSYTNFVVHFTNGDSEIVAVHKCLAAVKTIKKPKKKFDYVAYHNKNNSWVNYKKWDN